jgi:hypothetical protein
MCFNPVNKMGFCNGPSWVNPFRAISILFLFFFPSSFLVRADAAFSRPGLQLHPAWYGTAVNDGRKATGAAGAPLGTSLYEHFGGFTVWVIAITVVYALILPILLLVPKRLINTADGRAPEVAFTTD